MARYIPGMDTLATIRALLTAALPYAVGVGLPIVAIVWPIQYSQGQTIQRLVDQVADMKSSVDKVVDKIEGLDKHVTQSESDPEKIMAKVMGISAGNVSLRTVSFIADRVVVFPKTEIDKELLTNSGWELKSITPTISGYVPVDAKVKTDMPK